MRFDLVAEQRQAPGPVLVGARERVSTPVTAHPERAAPETGIVALVLQRDQVGQQVGVAIEPPA